MDFTQDAAERGVRERRFELQIEGETVPGLLWSPEDDKAARPMVLIGHGGTQHKRVDNVLSLGRRFVRHLGYSAVAIDAPGHGERITDPEAAEEARKALQARIASGPGQGGLNMSGDQARAWVERTRRGVIEWRATLDALEKAGLVLDGRIGYWGVSMGTAIGLPFVAAEPRVKAAVLGLSGLSSRPGNDEFEKAARSLSLPVLFVFQWDDELMSRQSGLDLFDAIGSQDKAMHVHPGGHINTPLYERDIYDAFFRRHLGAA
jgi:pimeloyl-ACP methyl ester carboxylesterase